MEGSSTSWEKLSNLKELHPVQVAKYAIAQVIQYESALTGEFIMSYKKETALFPMRNGTVLDTLNESTNLSSRRLRWSRRQLP